MNKVIKGALYRDDEFTPKRKYNWKTCLKHGWDALETPCPKCKSGDAPTHCIKHGWSATGVPCPKCIKGE